MPTTAHILYENEAWLPPLVAALEAEGFAVEPHLVWRGILDPRRSPAPGIWLNRMSPSSHTRGHPESVPLMRETLAWLEAWGRRIVNGSRALELEISKARQELVLHRHGIRSPRTVLGNHRDALIEAASLFDGPFLTKHNQGGKGLGIRLLHSADELADHLDSAGFDAGPRGQVVLQQYIAAAEPFITRVELVAGRFLYAMRSSTVDGFELCPSDACQLPAPDVCPADGIATTSTGAAKFAPSPLAADDPLVVALLRLCAAEGLEQAGIEFVEDGQGRRWVYDINGTTNYSSAIERHFGVDGMRELARHLARVD
jgi:hypothetical protein